MGPALIPILMYGGAALAAAGAVKQGNEKKAAADFEAAQLKAKAIDVRASGQRAEIEARRQAQAVASRAAAVNASEGGGYDKNMEDILSGIASEGRYRSLSSFYESETAATSYGLDADMRRISGKNARNNGYIAAGSSLLSSTSSLYSKPPTGSAGYGGGGVGTAAWNGSGV